MRTNVLEKVVFVKFSLKVYQLFSLNNLIDVTVFLIDMKNDFKKFNEIYNLYFPEGHACRTTIEINALPTDIAPDDAIVIIYLPILLLKHPLQLLVL